MKYTLDTQQLTETQDVIEQKTRYTNIVHKNERLTAKSYRTCYSPLIVAL